jgi:pseudaminic acid synthase
MTTARIARSIRFGHRFIGANHPPFVIAEMSGNHNGSLERALAIVDAAASAGANAIKLQTYTADTMTLNLREKEFFISDPKSLWKGKSLHELYQQAHTPWEWHKPIFDRCAAKGVTCFSTPFDLTAVDFLEEIPAPAYKISSFENTDLELISKVAGTGKPLLISTGMASVAELEEAVQTARKAGCNDLVLLKCTSAYPATPARSNLLTIPHLRELFDCEIGVSDHTLGVGAAVAAVVLGARIIEKHFTLSRKDGGVDAAFSLEPAEFNQLVKEIERAWQSLGKVSYGVNEEEKPSLAFRRSLYCVADIKSGDVITRENVRAIRPGLGLAPKFLPQVLGRRANRDLKRGTPLSWDGLA